MSLKDMWNNMKNTFITTDVDDYDEYEELEETVQTAQTPSTNANSSFRPAKAGAYTTTVQRPTAMKVVVVEPKVFEDSEMIANNLRDLHPVVINFENTDAHEAARIVDFISGSTFSLDGRLEKIGKDIFLCVPNNISVDFTDKAYGDLSDRLTWKEPRA